MHAFMAFMAVVVAAPTRPDPSLPLHKAASSPFLERENADEVCVVGPGLGGSAREWGPRLTSLPGCPPPRTVRSAYRPGRPIRERTPRVGTTPVGYEVWGNER